VSEVTHGLTVTVRVEHEARLTLEELNAIVAAGEVVIDRGGDDIPALVAAVGKLDRVAKLGVITR
jgi:uncharacterized coiled-coil protein SlyX